MPKVNNYKVGAIKRKLQVKGKTQPGDLISKMNAKKKIRIPGKIDPIIKKSNAQLVSISQKKRVAIKGLI